MRHKCMVSILALLLFSAWGCSSSSVTNTSDPCAGATEAGARQKFTYEQIVPCLNTVEKISAFMQNNVTSDRGFDFRVCGDNCYYPAALVYQNGMDDCDGHAILQCSFLEQNGLNALMIGLSVESSIGYNVCATGNNGAFMVLDNEGQIVGPFQSIEDIMHNYPNKMIQGGSLRSLKASQVTQVTTTQTSPNVQGLPWEFIDYE